MFRAIFSHLPPLSTPQDRGACKHQTEAGDLPEIQKDEGRKKETTRKSLVCLYHYDPRRHLLDHTNPELSWAIELKVIAACIGNSHAHPFHTILDWQIVQPKGPFKVTLSASSQYRHGRMIIIYWTNFLWKSQWVFICLFWMYLTHGPHIHNLYAIISQPSFWRYPPRRLSTSTSLNLMIHNSLSGGFSWPS